MKLDATNSPAIRDFEQWVRGELDGTNPKELKPQDSTDTPDLTPDYVWTETEYFLKCSDCENEQERCFSAEQALTFGKRDGWRNLGTRIVCPKCSVGYPV